jgi:ABC-2 type transport system ATP-binding protein/lipopolysaccharide transport system ATP-binding protein
MLGMDPESTGYENILLRGIIMGLTREEIESKKDEIAAFTDLGGYLALPVRAYSTGMQLRLAFGIATAILPEILVLDEIVGTGDAAFMDKAQTRFSSIVEASHILVLASHDLNIIEKLCTKVLWLNAGQIAFMGDCQDGVALYKQHR